MAHKRSASAGRFTFDGGEHFGNHTLDAAAHWQGPHGGNGNSGHHRLCRKSAKDQRRSAYHQLAMRQQDRRCRVSFYKARVHSENRQSAWRG